MLKLTYRPVAEADLPVICRFPRTVDELFFMYPRATFPLTVEQLQKTIAERSDATVGLHQGNVVVFGNLSKWEHGGECTIGNVIVDPTLRGCGIGRQFVDHMTELARTKYQARIVSLNVLNENAPALLLYTKMGFAPFAVEERIHPCGKRVAAIRMRKIFSN